MTSISIAFLYLVEWQCCGFLNVDCSLVTCVRAKTVIAARSQQHILEDCLQQQYAILTQNVECVSFMPAVVQRCLAGRFASSQAAIREQYETKRPN